jgi:serine/threonine protein kinase
MFSVVSEDFIRDATITAILGKGAYGIVYAITSPNGKLVVKESKDNDSKLGYPPDFITEIDMLVKFSRIRNVVSLKSVCFSDNSPKCYLLLEEMDMTLSKWFKVTPIKKRIKSLPHIITDIGGTLSILHSLNFIHNDIKANNILVKEYEDKVMFKLCDFGIAKHVTDPNMQYRGVYSYSNPFDRNFDVFFCEYWAFSVCVIETIIGRHMIRDSNHREHSKNDNFNMFKKRYISNKFDIDSFFRDNLEDYNKEMLPQCFWIFIESAISPHRYHDPVKRVPRALWKSGYEISISILKDVKHNIARQPKENVDALSNISSSYLNKLSYHKSFNHETFSMLINRFYIINNKEYPEDFNKYVEAAYVIIMRGNIKHLIYLDSEEELRLYQKKLLYKLNFQILTI